jgi:uncharacterized membrane protein
MTKVNFVIVMILILAVALISGLLFSFTIAVSPGLKHLSDVEYLKTMKNINKEILNPVFLFCFLCPLLLFPLTIYIQQNDGFNRWLLVAGFLTYCIVIGITAFVNVPLNNQLERLNLLNTGGKQLETFRTLFENRWTFWNNVRTVSSLLSSIFLTLYLLLSKN